MITVFLGVEAALVVGILVPSSWGKYPTIKRKTWAMHMDAMQSTAPSGYEIIGIVEQAASNRNLDTRATNNTSLNGPTWAV